MPREIPKEFQTKTHDPSPSSSQLMAKAYAAIVDEVDGGNPFGPNSVKLADVLDVSLGEACDVAMNLQEAGYVKISKRNINFCRRSMNPIDKTVKKYRK